MSAPTQTTPTTPTTPTTSSTAHRADKSTSEFIASLRKTLSSPKRLRDIIKAKVTKRIGKARWDIVAHKDEKLIDTIAALYAIGKGQTPATTFKAINCCGEENFMRIFRDLCKEGIILKPQPVEGSKKTGKRTKAGAAEGKGKDTPKTVPKPGANTKGTKNKGAMIKGQNLAAKTQEDLQVLLGTIRKARPENDDSVFYNVKFAEFTLVRMMVLFRNLCDNFSEASKELADARRELASARGDRSSYEEDVADLEKKQDVINAKLIRLIVGCNKVLMEKNQQLEQDTKQSVQVKGKPQGKGKKDKKQSASVSTRMPISQTCVRELTAWMEHAKTVIAFDPARVIVETPELIFKTRYDALLEEKQIGLYKSQQELFDFVTSNEKCLALVHTMLGSGKTTMVLAFCGWLISHFRPGGPKLLFTSPSDTVNTEVGNLAFGAGVPYGFAFWDQNKPKPKPQPGDDPSDTDPDDEKYKLSFSWSAFVDKKNPEGSAVMYICDIYTAQMLLEKRQEAIAKRNKYIENNRKDPRKYPMTRDKIPPVPEYIFMGDELTKDADTVSAETGFSITTEFLIRLAQILPERSVLTSATLPTYDQLPELWDAIAARHEGTVVKSFTSTEAKIGCGLISSEGELFAPHSGCKTVSEIESILATIPTNPFIGRFYTFGVLLEMTKTFKELGLESPDLTVLFDNPSKANQTNIQQTAYGMLRTLIETGDDAVVEKACVMTRSVGAGVNPATVLTSDIGRFNKGCLAFTSDPVATAFKCYRENFDNFLEKSGRSIFEQVDIQTILGKYATAVADRDKAKANTTNRSSKQQDDPCSRQEVEQAVAALNADPPVWTFPKALQLCSPEHLARSGFKDIDSIECNGTIGPDHLPKDSRVSDEILTMLASGVGIICESSVLDKAYIEAVLRLAKQGLIKIIFTDVTIAYGTNLSVSDIIFFDTPIQALDGSTIPSITDIHSIKTIFQMLGRAGRGGNMSFEARIWAVSILNTLIKLIQLYIKGQLDEGDRDEVRNIERAFKVMWPSAAERSIVIEKPVDAVETEADTWESGW